MVQDILERHLAPIDGQQEKQGGMNDTAEKQSACGKQEWQSVPYGQPRALMLI
jgi:hypothetical protein